MFRALTCELILLLGFAGYVRGQIGCLYPADEAYEDSTFALFRDRLIDAVEQRDTAYVLASLDPNILNSFGGSVGVAEFEQKWLSANSRGDLFTELLTVLRMGGHFVKDSRYDSTFIAPYVSSSPLRFDGFKYVVVVRRDAPVRRHPAENAVVIASLTYDIIPLVGWRPKEVDQVSGVESPWVKIELIDGTPGFMLRTDIRAATDYRAMFVLRDGRWVMRAFVAGD